MIDFEVKGADQFLRLSKALKDAGQTDVRKALHKGLRDTANQVKPEVAKGLAEALPKALASKGQNVKQAIVVKTGRDPGVTAVVRYGKAGRGLGASNARMVNRSGQFRHPVYGSGEKVRKEWAWVSQSVDGEGWFDKGWANQAPTIRKGLEAELERVADDIVRRARG